MKRILEYTFDLIVLTAVVLWTYYLFTHNPESLIESIGTHNGYILAFGGSLLAGLTFISVAVYPTVIALALGGLHPILTGILAALGLTIANLVFFYIGTKGHKLTHEHAKDTKFAKLKRKFAKWLHARPNWVTTLFIWIYVGFTPFPNNLLTVSGGFINFSYKRLLTPLLMGNTTLMIILGYSAHHGVSLLGI